MGAVRRYAPWMLFPLAVMIGGYALGEAMADRNNQWVKNQQKVNPYLVKSKKIDLALMRLIKTSLNHLSNIYAYRKTARTNDE